jgi:glycosyltransferase involved in cell wall biosynthesis
LRAVTTRALAAARARTDRTTVVVITYNYARYLTEAVESVLGQTRRPNVLIMDDASDDNTPDVVRRLMAPGHGRLECCRAASNQGLSRTRNEAARRVTTEWLIYLDADDWLSPDFVEKGEAWIDRHRGVDILTTDARIVRHDRRPVRFCARVPADWTGLLERNTIVQTSFVRRDVVARLGGYDPALDFEDWDFWIRAMKAGCAFGRLPGVHVYRREHGLNKSKCCDEQAATQAVRQRHPYIHTTPTPKPS